MQVSSSHIKQTRLSPKSASTANLPQNPGEKKSRQIIISLIDLQVSYSAIPAANHALKAGFQWDVPGVICFSAHERSVVSSSIPWDEFQSFSCFYFYKTPYSSVVTFSMTRQAEN